MTSADRKMAWLISGIMTFIALAIIMWHCAMIEADYVNTFFAMLLFGWFSWFFSYMFAYGLLSFNNDGGWRQ